MDRKKIATPKIYPYDMYAASHDAHICSGPDSYSSSAGLFDLGSHNGGCLDGCVHDDSPETVVKKLLMKGCDGEGRQYILFTIFRAISLYEWVNLLRAFSR